MKQTKHKHEWQLLSVNEIGYRSLANLYWTCHCGALKNVKPFEVKEE